MREIVWGLCVLLAFPCGGLSWELIRQKHFMPEPQIVPIKIVKQGPVELTHANIFSEVECRRMCRARMKAAQVAEK